LTGRVADPLRLAPKEILFFSEEKNQRTLRFAPIQSFQAVAGKLALA
jgi:hypothetical protein